MRVLVTGHRGFLGSRFADRLQSVGHRVVGVDIADDPSRMAYGACDLRTWLTLEQNTRFDLVVHCAAVVGGRQTIDRAPLAVADNLGIDTALFQWALRAKPGRIIYLSSSAAYPTFLQAQPGHRLDENDIDLDNVATPDQTYGWAKLTGEILSRHCAAEGVPVTVVRPFSGYGERQSADYPFPAFAARAAQRQDPFIVWGDGTQTRDWIHVDDVVDAALTLADNGVDGPVNLGWGEPVSMGELVMAFCEAAGYRPAIDLRTDQPTGVAWRVANTDLLNQWFSPRISLDEGIWRALNHLQAAQPA